MKLFPWWRRKNSEVLRVVLVNKVGREQREPQNYTLLSRDGYQKNVIAFRCVSLISTAISRIPLRIYRRTIQGPQEILQHPLLELLTAPNPMTSWQEFFYQLSAYLHIGGNAFI